MNIGEWAEEILQMLESIYAYKVETDGEVVTIYYQNGECEGILVKEG